MQMASGQIEVYFISIPLLKPVKVCCYSDRTVLVKQKILAIFGNESSVELVKLVMRRQLNPSTSAGTLPGRSHDLKADSASSLL